MTTHSPVLISNIMRSQGSRPESYLCVHGRILELFVSIQLLFRNDLDTLDDQIMVKLPGDGSRNLAPNTNITFTVTTFTAGSDDCNTKSVMEFETCFEMNRNPRASARYCRERPRRVR